MNLKNINFQLILSVCINLISTQSFAMNYFSSWFSDNSGPKAEENNADEQSISAKFIDDNSDYAFEGKNRIFENYSTIIEDYNPDSNPEDIHVSMTPEEIDDRLNEAFSNFEFNELSKVNSEEENNNAEEKNNNDDFISKSFFSVPKFNSQVQSSHLEDSNLNQDFMGETSEDINVLKQSFCFKNISLNIEHDVNNEIENNHNLDLFDEKLDNDFELGMENGFSNSIFENPLEQSLTDKEFASLISKEYFPEEDSSDEEFHSQQDALSAEVKIESLSSFLPTFEPSESNNDSLISFPTAKELSKSALKRIAFFQTAVYDARRESIIGSINNANNNLNVHEKIFFRVFKGMRGGKPHEAGIVFLKENRIYIVYKGTENSSDWMKNLSALNVKLTVNKYGEKSSKNALINVELHQGFTEAFLTSWINVQKAIIQVTKESGKNLNDLSFIFAGHSLGGAQATIGALAIMGYSILGQPIGQLNRITNQVKLVTFGAPKVFLTNSSKQVEELIGRDNIIRFVEKNDPVTKVPTGVILPYLHMGIEHVFSADNIKSKDNNWNNQNKNIFGKMINKVGQAVSSPLISHSNQTYFKYMNHYFRGLETSKTEPISHEYNPKIYKHNKIEDHNFMFMQSQMLNY
ncbi:MAG: lipase family protein [Myxococcales bacterium]|nr:lipase family protein [Myxococcales bacterium]USN50207.1 MAG: lipase family protein [Myxococcales bacterium]